LRRVRRGAQGPFQRGTALPAVRGLDGARIDLRREHDDGLHELLRRLGRAGGRGGACTAHRHHRERDGDDQDRTLHRTPSRSVSAGVAGVPARWRRRADSSHNRPTASIASASVPASGFTVAAS
jgi:hypothetical protein